MELDVFIDEPFFAADGSTYIISSNREHIFEYYLLENNRGTGLFASYPLLAANSNGFGHHGKLDQRGFCSIIAFPMFLCTMNIQFKLIK